MGANCYRNEWIEDNILIKNSDDFQQLAGKSTNKWLFNDKTIIIDATETPIQRPKKDKNNLILVKRKNTRSKHK
ncbi:hypothetical protein [Spiroplasma poulsonii]|uniref:hypothetical protein n=1 Tax=Spiroplasma poulsonii TaxID=2138 RepID=UPI001F4CA0CA|nr:hypothetical protein [Spiroplasma poulsonii]UNF61775.1 hypothetical protein MNU24_07645 [Spiroplasma poulsonii]